MNIKNFYQSLGAQLDLFSNSFPAGSLTPINSKLHELEQSAHKDGSQAATIGALFALSSLVEQQAATLRFSVLFEVFDVLITEKIEEIASGVFPSKAPAILDYDRAIQETEQLLTEAHVSLDSLSHSKDEDLIMAATESLSELEQKLEELKREKVEASHCASLTTALGCAGLRNGSNKCYVHGCLKGLWASRKFREIIERKADVLEAYLAVPKKEGDGGRRLTALFLHRLFLTFDSTMPVEVIEPEEKAIHDVLEEMAKYHPSIADGKQQDATEFLNWLFDDIFEENECLFSYVERKQRPTGLTVDFCIPSIDLPETSRGNLFIIQIPAQENVVAKVQAAFEPTIVEEGIDPESVLCSEKNAGKDQGALVEALSNMPQQVPVLKERIFQGEPPPCLFVQLWRQVRDVEVPVEVLKRELDPKTISSLHLTDEEILKLFERKKKVKVPASVDIPSILVIHHVDRPHVQYRLKGVVVHSGTPDVGHYYSYLLGEKTHSHASSSSVRHDDSRVGSVPYDQRLISELQEQGYILIYDKEES